MAKPVVMPLTDYDIYTSRIEAVNDVEIRAKVSGTLQEIRFREGDTVVEDQILYVLDDRRARADVAQLMAQEGQAEQSLALAQTTFERVRTLANRQAVSREELDQARAELAIAEAVLEGAAASVARAEIELDDTIIRAPFTGRIGASNVDVGALIDGGSTSGTLLAKLVSIDPVEVVFDASEADYLAYVRLDLAGEARSSRSAPAQVNVRLSDEDGWPHAGEINFVDNRLDPASGTIRIRASVANADGIFAPGLFADTRVPRFGPYDAMLVPDEVVLSDQAGRIVYTLNDDDTVTASSVVVGQLVDGMRVIRSGIESDDLVVLSSLMMVQPGGAVVPTEVTLAVPQAEAAQ
ncbi:efflux RND transporter periplasmic adaptor subunit [Nereida sp. MMG025]|uniref:efflux RND transporter periplasmic adaptor subunit n=1 Tax=Nereida sp. MMG025 TaxID=2909981 RepID=UPI00351D4016|nr:efflux RND transporter periplasmic adaptor subunit [Nereida sp. MMG025]